MKAYPEFIDGCVEPLQALKKTKTLRLDDCANVDEAMGSLIHVQKYPITTYYNKLAPQ